jgi:hypothetical protein
MVRAILSVVVLECRLDRRVLQGDPVAMKALMLGLVTVALLFGIAGCGGEPDGLAVPGQSTTTLSPMMQAYYLAHPGYVDGPLRPVGGAPEEIVAAIRERLTSARDIWLPSYLPPRFALAAPYNGDGSGSAHPNPYVWGSGYSVTYTDGAGYLIVFSNPGDDLSRGSWESLSQTVAGRSLRMQRGSEIVLVATVDDGGTPLLVAGGGFAGGGLATELVRVAASLSRR